MNTLTSAILLSALSPAAAFAQAAAPALPAPPVLPAPLVLPAAPAPRTETLRLKFKAGETLYYRLVEDTDGSYREPGGRLTPIKSHLEMQMHQTTTDVRETDSAGMIGFGIDSMAVTVDKKPPNTTPDPAILANLAALVVLPSGKIEETAVNPAFDADESLPGEDPTHMNALAGLGELPASPVKVGSTWKGSVFTGLVGEKTSAELSLTGWEAKDAATLAVIKQTLHGTFSTPAVPAPHHAGDARPFGDMKITGWTSGTRTVRFNVEAGAVESQDSVVWMTVLLTSGNENGKFTGLPTRMWIKVTSTLVRTDAPTKTAPSAKMPAAGSAT